MTFLDGATIADECLTLPSANLTVPLGESGIPLGFLCTAKCSEPTLVATREGSAVKLTLVNRHSGSNKTLQVPMEGACLKPEPEGRWPRTIHQWFGDDVQWQCTRVIPDGGWKVD